MIVQELITMVITTSNKVSVNDHLISIIIHFKQSNVLIYFFKYFQLSDRLKIRWQISPIPLLQVHTNVSFVLDFFFLGGGSKTYKTS